MWRLWVWVALGCWGTVAWGQLPFATRAFNAQSIGPTNVTLTIAPAAFPGMRCLTIDNSAGGFPLYVDVDGTGVADPGKPTSHRVKAGGILALECAPVGKEILVIGAIAPGGTVVADFHLTE